MPETFKQRRERELRNSVTFDQIERQAEEGRARAASLTSTHPADVAADLKRRATDLKISYEAASILGDEAVRELRARSAVDAVSRQPSLGATLGDPYLSTIADGDHKEMGRLAGAAQKPRTKPSFSETLSYVLFGDTFLSDDRKKQVQQERGEFYKGAGEVLDLAPAVFKQGAKETFYNTVGGSIAQVTERYTELLKSVGLQDTDAEYGALALRVLADAETRKSDALVPEGMNVIQKGALSGFRSLPGAGVGIASAAVGGPIIGAAVLGVQANSTSYLRGRASGLSVDDATSYAATDAGLEYVSEYLPFVRLFGDAKVGSTLGKRLIRNLVDEQLGEQFATASQDLNAWANLPENQDKPFTDYLSERPDAAVQTAIATLVASGVTNTIAGAIGATDATVRKVGRMRSGAQDAETLDTIMDSATKHKMRERDPDAFAQYVAQQTEGTSTENVYIAVEAVDTLFQSEIMDEDTQVFFEKYAEQIAEARLTGGDVVIPTSEIAARLAGTPVWEALKPDARIDAGGFSPRQIETEQKGAERTLEQRGEEIANAALDEIEANQPTAAVFEDVKAQLVAAGFTEDAAGKQAMLYAANRQAVGARYGMTALQYHQANPVEFQNAELGAAAAGATRVMDQRSVALDRNMDPTVQEDISNFIADQFGEDASFIQQTIGDGTLGVLGVRALDIPVDDVAANGGTSPLAVDNYAALNSKAPPVLVEKTDKGWKIVEGRHRLAAARKRGDTNISAVDVTGLRGDWAKFYDGDDNAIPAATFNQASRYDERFGDQPLTVADRFGDPSTLLQHDDWAILTAENPRGEQADEVTNARAMRDLEADLQEMGLVYTLAVGKYGQIENSFAVVGITQAEADMLGRKYDQDSVLTRAGLTYQDGSVNAVTGAVDVFTERPDDFFTEVPLLGVSFAIGIDFDHKIAPVSANTMAVLQSRAAPDVYPNGAPSEALKALVSHISSNADVKNAYLKNGRILLEPTEGYSRIERELEGLRAGGFVAENNIKAREIADRVDVVSFEDAALAGAAIVNMALKPEVVGMLNTPPVDADGMVELQHWSTHGDLRVTDPSRWGAAGKLLSSEERARIGKALNRTYFGIATGQPGGYVNEFKSGVDTVHGIARHEYRAKVPLSALYYLSGDPLNLKAKARKAIKDGDTRDSASVYESEIAKAGFIGFWDDHQYLGLVAAVFNPVEVSPTILYQNENPVFYSALARAIENTKQAKAPASQWKGILVNAPGVKPEELEWSGLLETLDFDPKAVFTREELAAVVEAGGIKIEERVLGRSVEEVAAEYGVTEEDDDYEIIAGDVETGENATQFSDWNSDSSNDTYRELLLTLPIGQGGNPERAPSTHWDQPAVVAHVRFMDKEDVDGNRVLFVEEVQSDWHQKGRDQGYATSPVDVKAIRENEQKSLIALETARENLLRLGPLALPRASYFGLPVFTQDRYDQLRAYAGLFQEQGDGGSPEFAEAVRVWQRASLANNEAQQASFNAQTGTPNAPFKTSWPALVMKRVIKYAVDGGYDKVAWTTGQQQAERYNLSESTGPLEVRVPAEGTSAKDKGEYFVKINALAADRLQDNGMGTRTRDYGGGRMTLRMTPAQMTEAFGADITRRAIEGAAASFEKNASVVAAAEARYIAAQKSYTDVLLAELSDEGQRVGFYKENSLRRDAEGAERDWQAVKKDGFILEGEDLQIGGEGMKAFYDRNLVNITNGLIKKAGGKVGPVRVAGEGFEEAKRELAASQRLEDGQQRVIDSGEEISDDARDRIVRDIARGPGRYTKHPQAKVDDTTSAQPGFEITDALRDQASGGFPLFQKTGKPRGQIAMFSDKMVITLFADADMSTLLHETGHLFVEELARNATRAGAPVEIKADWAAIKKWLKDNGHTVLGSAIPREAHELLARGFERYLMEGRAPSKNLEGAFGTFRAWLIGVYKTVQRLASPITPEIREVFDRLLATQDAIDSYRAEQNAGPLFTDKPADMTQAEFDAYRESVLGSRDEALARLTKKVMEDVRKRVNKSYRSRAKDVREDVVEELQTEPRFVALHLLRTGRWLGDGDKDNLPVKIDRQWFVSSYGAAALDRLPKGPFLVKNDGDDADFIAELTGFPSGAAMVEALFELGDQQIEMRTSGDRRSVIDKETDDRVKAVLEADGSADALSPERIEEEAQAAIESEQQGALLSAELRYLSRGTRETPTPYRLARVWAERKVRAGTVQSVASRAAVQQYARAAAKSGRLAEEALIAGDSNEAYRQKQAQLINHALFAEAKLAADKVDLIVARMKRLGKRAAMKTIDQDYMDRVHGLLEGFDFRKKTAKFLAEQQGFADWAAGQAELGFEVQVPPRLALNGVPYTRASVEELYGLDDAVKGLLHLGKLKQGILDGIAEREYAGLIDDMVVKLADLPDRKTSTEINDDVRPVSSVLSFLIKIETLADDFDGGDPNGPFNRLLTQRANDMENRRAALRDQALKPISEGYLGLSAKHRRRLEEKLTIPQFLHKGGELDPRNGQPVTMTRMELLAVALNTGNLSNLEKMAKGEGWNAADIQAVLRAELAKEDWDFVQTVWDSIGSLWPDIAATERALSGVVPEQVEITPIDTPYGIYRGGYYPVVYDPDRSQRAENNATNEGNDLFGMKSGISTPKGHTITRTEASGPILRSVEAVLFSHIEKVITRVSYAEYVRDVLRVIDNPRVRNGIDLKLGREYRKQIRPWLQRVVNAASVDQRGLNWAERFLRAARVNMSLVAMGFRISTGFAQVGGWNQSAGRIGPRYLALGMKTLLRDRGNAVQFVFDRSPEMERRNGEVNRDVADAMKMMRGKDSIVNKARVMAFWHIGMIDRYVVAVPTWLGAHAKGIDEGMTDKEASYYADKMVRTSQGNGAEKDLANWQSPNSEAWRGMTLFYTIFNVQLNAQWQATRDVKKGKYMKAAVLSAWFLMAAPLMDALVSGDIPDEDDDEDTWANWFFRNVFFNLFSGVPLVRDMSAYGERTMAGEYASIGTTPVLRAEDAIKKASGVAVKAAQGEELPDTWVKTAIETPGYFMGLPTGQAAATGQFLWDYSNGDTDPEGFAQWYRGLTKGKIEKEK